MVTPRVAILGTRGYPSFYGGFETLVRHLAPHLADAGWGVTVYGRHGAVQDHGGDPRVRSVVTAGLETRSLSALSYGLSGAVHSAVDKPDVALVMNVANGFWLPLLRARGIPTIVNVDGVEWERDKWGRLAKATFRAGARMTAAHADEIVVDAHEMNTYWTTTFDRPGTYIPYGGQECARLPVPKGLVSGQYILVVARFVPENSINEFLDAVETLSLRWKVAIVGNEGYGGQIDDRVESMERNNSAITWYRHISDDDTLFALWQHAGVYFHGHSVGGTNPALVQAMACGSAVVARDTSFNREVLADAGIYCEPTARSIAHALAAVMDDPARQRTLRTAALERARVGFT